MAAKHQRDSSGTGRTTRRRWRVPALLLTSALIGTSLTAGLVATQAEAAAPTTDAYLGGLGLHTTQCPVTPSNVIYVQPGTTIKFHADLTGLGALGGRGGLLGLETAMTNPLNARQSITVTAAANGFKSIAFGGQGTYDFSWTAKTGYIEVLGQRINTGVVAAVSGAKLTWQGQVVVSTRSQNCKLAPQVPGVQVSPSLPVVGNLPGVNLPGVQLPGVQVPGTTANPTTGSSSGAPTSTAPGGTAAKPGSTTSTTSNNPYDYTAPGCTGPCAVVPKGGGGGGSVGNAYDVTLGDIGDPAAATGSGGSSGSGSSGDASAAGADGAVQLGGGNDQIAVDRAFGDARDGGDSAPGLPTTLTIIAIAALAGASVLWFARRRLAKG